MKCCGVLLALAMHLSLLQIAIAFTIRPVAVRSRVPDAPWQHQQHGSCIHTTSPRDRQLRQTLHATSSNCMRAAFWRNVANTNGDTLQAAKLKLKERLLETVRPTNRGISTSEEQRQDIEELITALEPFNPNAKSVTSESLSALWVLEWTTEKEILFLMEWGLPGKPSGLVQQEIDVEAKTLSNRMLFGDDSVFEVSSSIEPEEYGPRVYFEFEACKLSYGGWLTVPLPPVGEGWFESVYLDEDLRVTRDVRGDVTVLVKSRE
ncbi:unnamed protein product [Pylaiella littoralis]